MSQRFVLFSVLVHAGGISDFSAMSFSLRPDKRDGSGASFF
jgi:hypothetical protein